MRINKDVAKFLRQGDKAELTDFFNEHIGDSDKCLIIFAQSDNKGGLTIFHSEVGFEFEYEIKGFLDMLNSNDEDEDDDI